MLANEFLAFEHSPLFFVDIIIHCSLLRTCRVRVEEKEEFLVYTVLWTLTCHPYLESATALSDILPEFCLSTSIKGIHVNLLRYVSALQCLVMILITYMILKLNNFTCQVPLFQKLCKPIKSCMNNLRSIWNSKASVIDVIATLLLLSYTKIILSSSLVFRYSHIKNISEHPPKILDTVLHIDPTVKYFSKEHIIFVIPAVACFAVLACILLLLICYPFGFFRRALTCCCGTRSILQHVNTFVEKLQGHYKDRTDSRYDMRLFSVLYLVLRQFLFLVSPVMHVPSTIMYLVRSLILFASSIAVLTARPYKVECYSTYDGLLLALFGLQGILIHLIVSGNSMHLHNPVILIYLLALLMAIPQAVLIIYIVVKIVQGLRVKCKSKKQKYQDLNGSDDESMPDFMTDIERANHHSGRNEHEQGEKEHLLAKQ